MAMTKREKYETARARVKKYAENGEIPERDADAILRWAAAYDDDELLETPGDVDTNQWGESRTPSTLRNWLLAVSAFARDLDGSILDASAHDLNVVAKRMYNGDATSVNKPSSKGGGRSSTFTIWMEIN